MPVGSAPTAPAPVIRVGLGTGGATGGSYGPSTSSSGSRSSRGRSSRASAYTSQDLTNYLHGLSNVYGAQYQTQTSEEQIRQAELAQRSQQALYNALAKARTLNWNMAARGANTSLGHTQGLQDIGTNYAYQAQNIIYQQALAQQQYHMQQIAYMQRLLAMQQQALKGGVTL